MEDRIVLLTVFATVVSLSLILGVFDFYVQDNKFTEHIVSITHRVYEKVQQEIFIERAYASDCNLFCVATIIANQIWSNFIAQNPGTTIGTSSGLYTNFGGRVTVAIPCQCSASTAFIINPVHGPSGTYNVTWFPPSQKKHFALGPATPASSIGRWTLGQAQQGGQCVIFVILWCFEFETDYDISPLNLDTVVGTSLIP